MEDKSIVDILLSKKAVMIDMENLFTWSSGIKSPIYCDNRKLISYVEEREFIVNQMEIKLLQLGWDFDVVGGTATAAIPWAAFLAERLNKPMVYIRSEKKGHGAGKRIEGDIEALKGKKVLIVEDLISTGGSSLSALEAVEEEMDSEVAGVIAIFEYGFEMAKERFKEEGVDYATLTNFEALVALMQSRGEFDQDDVIKTVQFMRDPNNW